MSTKFCLPSDVHPLLNNQDGWEGEDTLIATQIRSATALIKAYTRREWVYGSFVDFHDVNALNIQHCLGRGVLSFYFGERPVDTAAVLPEIKFNTGGNWADTEALQSTEYELEPAKNRVVIYPSYTTQSARSLRIAYNAGYPLDAMDTDLVLVNENLKQACAIQAAFATRRVLNETSGAKQKQDKQGFVNYSVNPSGLVGEALTLIKSQVRLLTGSNA